MNSRRDKVKQWIRDYIIQYDLCPFAKWPYDQDRINYIEISAIDETTISSHLVNFINSKTDIDTSFLIYTKTNSYLDYLEDFYLVEDAIEEIEELQGIKLVPFHPNYEHRTVEHDTEHFTNRAPFPMIQFLRQEMVENLVDEPKVKSILKGNAVTLKTIGIDKLKIMHNDFR